MVPLLVGAAALQRPSTISLRTSRLALARAAPVARFQDSSWRRSYDGKPRPPTPKAIAAAPAVAAIAAAPMPLAVATDTCWRRSYDGKPRPAMPRAIAAAPMPLALQPVQPVPVVKDTSWRRSYDGSSAAAQPLLEVSEIDGADETASVQGVVMPTGGMRAAVADPAEGGAVPEPVGGADEEPRVTMASAVRKMVPAEQDEGVDVAVERVAVDARDADWAVDASTEAVAPAVEAAVAEAAVTASPPVVVVTAAEEEEVVEVAEEVVAVAEEELSEPASQGAWVPVAVAVASSGDAADAADVEVWYGTGI